MGNLKKYLNPQKTENILVIELVIVIFFFYYRTILSPPSFLSDSLFYFILLIAHVSALIIFYVTQRFGLKKDTFKNMFFIYSQILISLFIGFILNLMFILLNYLDVYSLVLSLIPLIFVTLLLGVDKLDIYQVGRFWKWALEGDIWEKLDTETKKDFKLAELNMRADNIGAAILSICKGIERELKLTIFDPFKENYILNLRDDIKLNDSVEFDLNNPRIRTYFNFINYLNNRKHLTFGNIPFFLLNLTDSEMKNYTNLFREFSYFLQNLFGEKYENILFLSKLLFNHDLFTVVGIKISDLRNEAAHPQKYSENPIKSDKNILSVENYIRLMKILAKHPYNLIKKITELKNE